MRAAFYEKDITPPLGCYLAGYYINHVAEDVLDTLFVRTALFENDGQYAALVSIDACEFPDDMHRAVTDRITAYTGLGADCILLSVNHTHKGIPIYDSPEINAFADAAFKDVVYRLIADSVILAYKRLDDADAFFGESEAKHIAFNRTYVMRDGTYRTNVFSGEAVRPLGEVDERTPTIFVKDKNGKPKGCILSFACHQDCTPGSQYSGAFAHVLSNEMKKKYGDDFITVFLPGTSGDINHIDPAFGSRMPQDTYIKMGKVLAESLDRAYESAVPLGETVRAEKEVFCAKRRILNRKDELEEIRKFTDEGNTTAIRNMLFYRCCVKDPNLDVYVQCINIGGALVYGYPGEVFVEFGLDLKRRSPSDKNLIATLSNSGCGYIATKDAFAPQSRLYEKRLCFGACLEPTEGYRITDELLALADKVK